MMRARTVAVLVAIAALTRAFAATPSLAEGFAVYEHGPGLVGRDRRRIVIPTAVPFKNPQVGLVAGETELVDGLWASGGMFDTLGVPAMLGRTFTQADDTRGGGPAGAVAVISYRFWQRRPFIAIGEIKNGSNASLLPDCCPTLLTLHLECS